MSVNVVTVLTRYLGKCSICYKIWHFLANGKCCVGYNFNCCITKLKNCSRLQAAEYAKQLAVSEKLYRIFENIWWKLYSVENFSW